ncbi:MAG TPA: hypothetical protein PK239_16910 [Chitinophagales bacterium]|nr:hypothetical protein [Chitinophagales bacterium]
MDACSYFYQRSIYLDNGKSLFDYTKKLSLSYSQIVHREISNNASQFKQYFTEIPNDILKRHNHAEQTPNFHGRLFTTTQTDEGEKHNLSLAIAFAQKGKPIVYLSDDLSAIGNPFKEHQQEQVHGGHLSLTINSFPFFKIWTSFDCILYLRFRRIITFDIAETAIINLNTFLFKNDEEYRQLKDQRNNISNDEYSQRKNNLQTKHTQRRQRYQEYLRIIEKVLTL